MIAAVLDEHVHLHDLGDAQVLVRLGRLAHGVLGGELPRVAARPDQLDHVVGAVGHGAVTSCGRRGLELDGHGDLGGEADGAVGLDAAAEAAHRGRPARRRTRRHTPPTANRAAWAHDAPDRADGVDLVHALGAAAHQRRLGAGEVVADGLAAEPADRLHQVVGEQLPASPRRAAVGGWVERLAEAHDGACGTVAAPGRRSAGCARCRRGRRARSARPTSGPAGRRRCGPCAAGRRATGCPPGRCRGRRPGAARRRRPRARPSPCGPARARSGSGPSPGTAGGSSTSPCTRPCR